ncbi:hypothetical protein LguiB_027426 [Lonicera macranthoides]
MFLLHEWKVKSLSIKVWQIPMYHHLQFHGESNSKYLWIPKMDIYRSSSTWTACGQYS